MTGLAKDMAEKVLRFLSGQASMPAVPRVFISLGTVDGEVFTETSPRVQMAGPVITNGATSMSNAAINHAQVPSWVMAGMQAYSEPAGLVLGTVKSVGERQVVLAETVVSPVSSGHTVTYTAFAIDGDAAVSCAPITLVSAEADAWALFDANGVMTWLGELGDARRSAISTGDQLIMPPGSFRISLRQSVPVPTAAPVEAPQVAPATAASTPPPPSLSRAPRGRTAIARA